VTLIASHLSTTSEDYRQNRQRNLELCEDLAAQKDRLRQGGGGKAQARHREQGKLFVRDRIAALCDPGTPFLEIGLFAAHEVYGEELPAAGVVAGVGSVQGRLCMIVANDATVKGGTYYPLTVKKHLRAQEIALENRLPCVNGAGTIFLGGPPLVNAATDEDVRAEELGGSRVHTELSGVADHFAQDDAEALATLRELVSRLGRHEQAQVDLRAPEAPVYDPEELLGLWPRDLRRQIDVREVLTRLVDGSRFTEFKARYGTTLVTGFAHLEGMPCGILASNGVLFSESALKAAHFIQLCTTQGIPLLFLQNITGFMVGAQYERGGIAKDGAKMVHAVATARVPKLTLLLGGSFGAGNYGMCGRAYGPRFLWTWPTARISVMGGEQAAQVLVTVKRDRLAKEGGSLDEAEAERIAAPIRETYEREGHPYYASARLWDDGVIDPRGTRQILAASLACALSTPIEATRTGVFRF